MTTRRAFALLGVAVIVCGALVAAFLVPARAPDKDLGLTLLVNHRTHIEAAVGTPLVFEVSLTSGRSATAFTVGSRWRPWHAMVRLERVTAASVLPWPVARIGAPRATRMETGNDGPRAMSRDAGPVASLEGGRAVYVATYAVSPEDADRVAPDTYRVSAVIESPFWLRWGWRGRARSAPVTIVVTDPAAASARRAPLERERLNGRARYFMSVGRFHDAQREAAALVTLEPGASSSYVLLGDALAALKRPEEALAAYRRALALAPRTREEPRALMTRMQSLLTRAGAKSEPRAK